MGGKTRAQKRRRQAREPLRFTFDGPAAWEPAQVPAPDFEPAERAQRVRGLLWAAAVAWAGVAAAVLVFLAR